MPVRSAFVCIQIQFSNAHDGILMTSPVRG